MIKKLKGQDWKAKGTRSKKLRDKIKKSKRTDKKAKGTSLKSYRDKIKKAKGTRWKKLKGHD